MRPLDLEAIEVRCEAATRRTWWDEINKRHVSAKVWTEDIPALVTEVRRLRRELHDERVWRDEWEKMYGQAIAGTEVERLQAELAAVKAVAKTWFKKAMKCKKKLNRVRQDAQDQSDEVQELWLSPCEAEGLKRQLARVETQFASIREAIEWLWGFWDGNTLVAKPGYEDDIRNAWHKLLMSTDVESLAATQLLLRLSEAEHAVDELTYRLDTERRLRREARQRLARRDIEYDDASSAALVLEERLVTVDRALLLAKAPSTFDDGTSRSAFSRILWLKNEIDALKAERHRLQHSLDSQLKTTLTERNKRRCAETLAALVTPELAELLDELVETIQESAWDVMDVKIPRKLRGVIRGVALRERIEEASALAARIREALEEHNGAG